jgi:hypothetical protein
MDSRHADYCFLRPHHGHDVHSIVPQPGTLRPRARHEREEDSSRMCGYVTSHCSFSRWMDCRPGGFRGASSKLIQNGNFV